MDASDWIAVVSAGIALLAAVVSARSLQLQRAGAIGSTQQQFEDYVHKLELALGKSGGSADGSSQGQGPPQVDDDAVLSEIQTLALDADSLVNVPISRGWRRLLSFLWGASSKPAQVNWYDTTVLASSFGEVWDLERAARYWQMATDLCTKPDAKVGAMARVLTFRNKGDFYYLRDEVGDLDYARTAYNDAFNTLKAEVDGNDVTYCQQSTTRLLQAAAEVWLDNTEEAAKCVREAWERTSRIRSYWRRMQHRDDVASFVAYGGDPERFERYGGLPEELKEEISNLRAQQQTSIADAWRQGFAAAKQPTRAARRRAMPGLHSNPPQSGV